MKLFDYYPSGMEITPPAGTNSGTNPYLYSGKEVDRMHGLNEYDFSARWMDPATSGFTTPDPLVEAHPWESPYSYCGGDPVNRVDPTGLDWYRNGLDYQWVAGKPTDSQNINGKKYTWSGKTCDYSIGDKHYFGDETGHSYLVHQLGEVAVTPYSFVNFITTFGAGGSSDAPVRNGGGGSGNDPSASSIAGFTTSATGTFTGALGAGYKATSNASKWSSAYKIAKTLEDTGIKVSESAVKNGIPKLAKSLGEHLAVASVLITATDATINGKWENHHTADIAVTGALYGLGIVCPVGAVVIGGGLLVGDMISYGYNGKSMTQNFFDK